MMFHASQIMPNLPKYFYFRQLEEIELKQKELALVESFFEALTKFKFIP